MKSNFSLPRIIIGATGSGVGKTTITCGILMALRKRGLKVASFKCGPDYIDPMFHRKVLGIPSTNLDLFFTDRETTVYIAHNHGKNMDIGVIEGVMGYYDGIKGTTTMASTYELARETETPGILIVNGKGKSLSLLAEIKGFLGFREDNNIKGVIVNNISKSMYGLLKDEIETLGIKPLGYFPNVEGITLESRHLGLVSAGEVKNLQEILEKLGEMAEESLNIDDILSISRQASNLVYPIPKPVETFKKYCQDNKKQLTIAVAMDKAFNFYYMENLNMLKDLGCKLVKVSPLEDEKLPDNIDGIILGGGYPELFGKQLAENKSFRENLKEKLNNGMPCLAECGGFMYLHEYLEDKEGTTFPMVGILKGKVYPLEKLGRFGYIDLTVKEDNFLAAKGTKTKGHEFHYWESENPGKVVYGKKPLREKNWDCIVSFKNIFAGFPHIYFWSNPQIPINYVKKAVEYSKK